MLDFLGFLYPKFVKFKILTPEASLQNLTFCKRFQNSGHSRFFGLSGFL